MAAVPSIWDNVRLPHDFGGAGRVLRVLLRRLLGRPRRHPSALPEAKPYDDACTRERDDDGEDEEGVHRSRR
jgi:hypothetical protein